MLWASAAPLYPNTRSLPYCRLGQFGGEGEFLRDFFRCLVQLSDQLCRAVDGFLKRMAEAGFVASDQLIRSWNGIPLKCFQF